MDKFIDVKIIGLDDGASGPSGEGALMRMVLDLNVVPQSIWKSGFTHAWRENPSMTKRRAEVNGSTIVVTCLPDELQSQIDQMNAIIPHLNADVRERVAQAVEASKAHAEMVAKERDAITSLKGKLRFD